MNREQRRAEQKAQTQKTKQKPIEQAEKTASPHRPLAFWMVGLFAAFGMLFGLWSINTASGAAAKENPAPAASVLAIDAPRSFTPDFLASVSSHTDAPSTNNAGVVKAGDLKQGDKVWHNGQWQTVVSVERSTPEATLEPAISPRPVLEADIHFDLSQSNSGKTFDLTRLAPCVEKVALTNGAVTTVGELKAGDSVYLTGGNVGRVVSIEKKEPTPTPSSAPDANGNSPHRVIATTKRMTDRILYLYTSVELVQTTPDHPFAVKGKGFVEAGKLQPGDVLETQDGKLVYVERTEVRNEPQLVYNLEVENAHNFFVGKNAMLVHNGGDCVPNIVSRIKDSSRLVREAEDAGRSLQPEIDKLTAQLMQGNMNPGIGSRSLFNGISEARSANGARVYFRQVGGNVEILAKYTKANQDSVIATLQRLYGK